MTGEAPIKRGQSRPDWAGAAAAAQATGLDASGVGQAGGSGDVPERVDAMGLTRALTGGKRRLVVGSIAQPMVDTPCGLDQRPEHSEH